MIFRNAIIQTTNTSKKDTFKFFNTPPQIEIRWVGVGGGGGRGQLISVLILEVLKKLVSIFENIGGPVPFPQLSSPWLRVMISHLFPHFMAIRQCIQLHPIHPGPASYSMGIHHSFHAQVVFPRTAARVLIPRHAWYNHMSPLGVH